MWVSAFRRHLLTLGNNTTNRIESFNSRVKSELRKKQGMPPSLPETISLLLELVSRKDCDATYKDFRNSATVIANVQLPEMEPAGRMYNDAGFKLLEQQALKMKNKKLVLHVGATGGLIVEDAKSGKLYDLCSRQEDPLECCCTFSCAFPGLPCCHVLYSRKERGMDLFDSSSIADRWLRSLGLKAPGRSEGDACLTDNATCHDYSSADEEEGMLCFVYF